MSTKTKNAFLFIFGFYVGALNAFRHRLFGYSHPRPFSPQKLSETIAYNKSVVHNWKQKLASFQKSENPFLGKDVVEIGPGYDYGAGIVMLSFGASSYRAIDRFSLSIGNGEYYHALLDSLQADMVARNIDSARLSEVTRGIIEQGSLYSDAGFSVIHSPIEDVFVEMNGVADVIVSQAALEHVNDIEGAFRSMYGLLRNGGVMCHEIDFQTHTGILRERDPLNIFRYSKSQWQKWFSFPGCPNRYRPDDFVHAVQVAGFKDVSLIPIRALPVSSAQKMKPFLAEPFQSEPLSTLSTLSAVLLARKS